MNSALSIRHLASIANHCFAILLSKEVLAPHPVAEHDQKVLILQARFWQE
jgi:hypothetical protein